MVICFDFLAINIITRIIPEPERMCFFSASFHLFTLHSVLVDLIPGKKGGGGRYEKKQNGDSRSKKNAAFWWRRNRMWRKIRVLRAFTDEVELCKWGLFPSSLTFLLKNRSSLCLNGWNYDHSFQSILTCYLMGLGFFIIIIIIIFTNVWEIHHPK